MPSHTTPTGAKASAGFTLIELIITVAIVAILASIAVPAYQDSVKKSRRTAAQAALSGFASAMERHATEKNSYLGAAGTSGTPANTGSPWIFSKEAPLEGGTKFYDLTISAATQGTYTLRATPKGGQVGDGMLELDSTGARRWDRNNDGSFGAGENCWASSC